MYKFSLHVCKLTTSRYCIAIFSILAFMLVSSPALTEDNGALYILIFLEENSKPVADAEVFIKGVDSYVTNSQGAAKLLLSKGEYEIIIDKSNINSTSVKNVKIVAGEVTELIVTIKKDGSQPVIDMEVATHKLSDSPTEAKQYENLPKGTLSGKVMDIEKTTPVSSARIYFRGYSIEAKTDNKGEFSVELPEGKHYLSVVHSNYSSQNVDEIEIKANQTTSLTIELTPSAIELESFRVVAPHVEGGVASVLEERRTSNAVSDVIGADQMAKTGDSSAASALRRVTGLTLVGGKYVYVRGMGERYSSTLLNRSSLPSPEPERRVIPLDLFPAGILKSMVIQKTYSPDLPGEFGGGTILLNTKGRPEEFVLSVSLSTGYLQDTTFEDGLTYKGGAFDFFGIDDGARALPSNVSEASSEQALMEQDAFSDLGYTPEELETFGESMPNVWTPSTKLVPPNFGFSFTVGDTYEVEQTPFGFLLAFSFDNDWESRKTKHNTYVVGTNGELESQHSYNFNSTNNNISMGAIIDLSAEILDRHKFKNTLLLIRTTDNEARIYKGFNRDVGTDILVSRLRWVERMLISEQISGEHTFPKAKDLLFNWRYTYTRATRFEPDRREIRKDLEKGTDNWYLSDRPEGNQRVFSNLSDNNHDIGIDFTLPYPVWNKLEAEAKVGGLFIYRDRNVDTRRFKFKHKGKLSGDSDILVQEPEAIFVPENIGSNGFQLEEITRATDNYKANQMVGAGYLLTTLPILENLRLEAGIRLEYSKQEVETFELFNPLNTPVVATLATLDYLPSCTLTWQFYKNMQFRSGYSLTVSRPDFRELSPATFNDVVGGRQIYGNPDLLRTRIHNVDMRVEWYPSTTESISLGFFFKNFIDPIETIVVASAQQSITYANAKSAINLGGELEYRKHLDFIHKSVKDIYIAGNVAYIYSKISLDENNGVQTTNERALQGQSPYVVNAQIGYDNVDTGTSVSLVYNVFGERIVEVGAQGAPDVIEQPFHQLDLIFSQNLGMGFNLKFKIQNFIDQKVQFKQGGKTTESYRKGRKFSLSLSWDY